MTATDESKIAAATDIKDEIAAQGHDLASSAAQEASALAGEVREQASTVARNARDQLEEQADAQTRKIGEGIQNAKRQLESMTEGAEPGLVTSVAQQLAGSLGSIADTIEDGGVHALADDLRSFARRQPGLFLLGAGAVGFFAARLLRHAGTGGTTQATRVNSTSATLRPTLPATGSGIDQSPGLPAVPSPPSMSRETETSEGPA